MQDYYLLKWAEEMTKWPAVGCCSRGCYYLWLCSSFLEVMENTEIHVVPNILMMVGLASIGTNWVASRVCQDSLDATRFPRWKVLLLAWFAVAALLCCLLIAVVVLSYALQGRLEESLKVRPLGWVRIGGWQVKWWSSGWKRCQYGLVVKTEEFRGFGLERKGLSNILANWTMGADNSK